MKILKKIIYSIILVPLVGMILDTTWMIAAILIAVMMKGLV